MHLSSSKGRFVQRRVAHVVLHVGIGTRLRNAWSKRHRLYTVTGHRSAARATVTLSNCSTAPPRPKKQARWRGVHPGLAAAFAAGTDEGDVSGSLCGTLVTAPSLHLHVQLTLRGLRRLVLDSSSSWISAQLPSLAQRKSVASSASASMSAARPMINKRFQMPVNEVIINGDKYQRSLLVEN